MKVVGDRSILMPNTDPIYAATVELTACRDAAGQRTVTVHLLNVAASGGVDDPTRPRGDDGRAAASKCIQIVRIDRLVGEASEVTLTAMHR